MSGHELIARDDLLDEEGHLSDVGATVLGDGQSELVPADILSHVDSCAICCVRMGGAALLSVAAAEALVFAHARASEQPVAPKVAAVAVSSLADRRRDSGAIARRYPISMVAAALFAACVGLLPTLYGAPGWLRQTATLLRRLAPVMAKSSYVILKHGGSALGPLAFVLPWASAMALMLVLVLVGVVLAKRLPRVAMIERGVQR
jgi:hypothetical protein